MKKLTLFKTRGSARWLIALMALLTLGIGQMWADVTLYYQNGMPDENYCIGDGGSEVTMTQSTTNTNRYYYEATLTKGTYGFYIKNGNDFYKNNNPTVTSNRRTEVVKYDGATCGGSNHRIKYTVSSAGTYIFTYEYDTRDSKHYVYVCPKNDETVKVAYDVQEGHSGWYNLNNYTGAMTQDGINYYVDLDLSATSYYMFIQISTSIYWKGTNTLNVDGAVSLYDYGTSDGGGSADKIPFDLSSKGAGKYRLTWNHGDKTVKLNRVFNVEFDGNGSTDGSMADQTILSGTETSLSENVFAKTYYTFDGWNTEADGSGTPYSDGEAVTLDASTGTDLTLYAQWKQVLTLDDNGGSKDGSVTVHYKSSSVSGFSEAEKDGYTCTGYYTATTGGNKIFAASTGALSSYAAAISDYVDETDNSWKYNGTPSLYAQWTPTVYTISFNGNKGSRLGTPSNIQADVTVTFDDDNFSDTEIDIPVLAGYEFGGYYTDAAFEDYQIVDATGKWTKNKTGYLDESGNWIKSANTTLYAKWTANTYTVTFNATLNKGTCDTTSMVVTYGNTYGSAHDNGKLPTPTAPAGYSFSGWFTSNSGGTQVTSSSTVSSASDHTLYAQFTEISYVYFYNNLGWDYVFVTYDAYWDQYTDGGSANDNGAGNYAKIYHQMSPIEEGSLIYRDEIPASVISSWKYNICFNSEGLGTVGESSNYNNFNSGEAVFRRDFDSYSTMFVPANTNTGDFTKNSGKCKYRSSDQWIDYQDGDEKKPITDYRYQRGYWRKYNDAEAGYVLKGDWDGEANDLYFKNSDGSTSFSVTKSLPANTTYKFRIYKHCKTSNTYSSWFVCNSSATITSSVTDWNAKADIAKTETSRYDNITTSVAGDYTFTLTCATDGKLYLSVDYPLAADDYRVLYSWNDGSAHTHASEIIKAEPNSEKKISVFVHKATNVSSQSLKIQKCASIDGSGVPSWTDVNTITLPSANITANGVYNFVITQPASGEPTGAFSEAYSGKYYVRSEATNGGWDYYIEKGDTMTYSEYSNSSAQTISAKYTHYYCQYIDNTTQSVSFTVATKYSPSISDTLGTDAILTSGSKTRTVLTSAANVRFAWNQETNALSRGYLLAIDADNYSLVLHGSDDKVRNSAGNTISASDKLAANELKFSDAGDWTYELDFRAIPSAAASLIYYYGSKRYLVGSAESHVTILGGTAGETSYKMHATYDFKTSRYAVEWVPDGDITSTISDVDMLWVRKGQDAATQVTFGTGGSLANATVVGAIQFDYNDMIGKVTSWTSDSRPLLKYFISFPFAVDVADIFGLNGAEYGREYVIQKYNGADRALKGLYLGDDGTFWEDLAADATMNANEGYCLIMDNDYLNDPTASIWENKSAGSSIYLYFPAKATVTSITDANKAETVDAHTCEIDKTFDGDKNHMNTDSHWNLIGNPLFQDAYVASSVGTYAALNSFYEWNSSDNSWGSVALSDRPKINAMSCFLVQWAGTVTWSKTKPGSYSASAPRRKTAEETVNYLLKLELSRNNETADWTYVEMKDDASEDFVLCEDLYKIVNAGKPNIYAYAGNYDVAYSQVPVQNQTVSVGVVIRQSDTYTFSMPSDFSGEVTLIDTEANTRTNLALDDYEVYLEKGTINNRFKVEINVKKVITAVDGVEEDASLKDGKAHKFIQNGQLFILREGRVYSVTGALVK